MKFKRVFMTKIFLHLKSLVEQISKENFFRTEILMKKNHRRIFELVSDENIKTTLNL